MSEDEQKYPRYQSHKVVEAFQIEGMQLRNNTGTTVLVGNGHRVEVTSDYVKKHEPKEGGWFIRYPDGYMSWSPDEAFREGYTPFDPDRGMLPGIKPWNPPGSARRDADVDLRERCITLASRMHPPGTNNGVLLGTAEAIRRYVETGETEKANA